MDDMLPTLRKRLQDMTELFVDDHPSVLLEIGIDHPTTIIVLASATPIQRYTCILHALDLTEHPDYIEVAGSNWGKLFAGAEFAKWLVASQRLDEIELQNATAGSLVFYFAQNDFQHVGIFSGDDRVISKWGTGHLYGHQLLEVPASYGQELRCYKRPDAEQSMFLFLEFLDENAERLLNS